jgi:hypothetical protein
VCVGVRRATVRITIERPSAARPSLTRRATLNPGKLKDAHRRFKDSLKDSSGILKDSKDFTVAKQG